MFGFSAIRKPFAVIQGIFRGFGSPTATISQIALVIALRAAAAILGDSAGYLIGRKGGRWLLLRPGPFARHRAGVLEVGEPFFARHGSTAVFLGRWILGLRTWAPVARRREPHAVALVRTHDLSASLISKVSGGQVALRADLEADS